MHILRCNTEFVSSMNSPFSNQFLDEMRAAMLDQQTRVTHQLSEIKSGAKGSEFPDYGEGEDEDAEEVAAYDANIRLKETLETDERDLVESFIRLDKGTYGVCKYCNEPIDEQRLRARPTSSSCVACKKALTQEV